MRRLNYELKQLARTNRDGAASTQHFRERQLTQMANQLHDLGYRGMSARSLRTKHVEALVRCWREGDPVLSVHPVSAATIRNRLAALRWWAAKVGKQNTVARSNAAYGLDKRGVAPFVNRAVELDGERLAQVRDPHVRMSLALQSAFGLRREEAIKFSARVADQGDRIVLRPSWTKGGRGRTVPIVSDAQREVLAAAARLSGRGSLIPADRRYVEQLRIYERETAHVGLCRMHGLRHAYAQVRYEALTGRKSAAAGGPRSSALSPAHYLEDRAARKQISRELGHERVRVTTVYLGE